MSCGPGGAGAGGGGDDDDGVAADGPLTDAAPSDAAVDGAPPPEPPPACTRTCLQPSDCSFGVPGSQGDADNHECVDGLCRWLGCHTDDECVVSYNRPDMICEAGSGGQLSYCRVACTTASDCPFDFANGVTDADNYQCVDGVCRWRGCLSTDECNQDSPGTICTVRDFAVEPLCYFTCDDVADCVARHPGTHAGNFACDDGACVWQGCTSNADCSAEWVCTP
jgi:hypothetical protein